MSQIASPNSNRLYLHAAEQLRNNPGQWAAYESKGNCVILAGPGSGKTKTLTIKMARMLNEDIRAPQGIACVTYSTECARELKRRLASLGIEESNDIYIGTVHGFCLNHIIRPYAKLAKRGIVENFAVPDGDTWMKILGTAVDKVGINENPIYLRTRVNRYRRTYLDRQSSEWREKDPETAILIECFEKNLHDQGFLDFDDMVLIGLNLIQEERWVRKALKSRFPILIVDEYQDLGVPLHEIVLSLCRQAYVRILAVGDPDQSIYGFAGANPKLLRELAAMEGVQTISLRMNYRSGKTIIAGSIVALGEDRDYEAAQDHSGEITFWECPNGIDEQVEIVCRSIIPQSLERRKGRNIGDIAVLYPDRYDATRITRMAQLCGLKYVGGDKEIRYELTPLTRWIEDCAAWCSSGWKLGSPKLSSILRFWQIVNNDKQERKEQKVLRERLVSFLWNHRAPSEPLRSWLDALLSLGLQEAIEQQTTRTDERESLKGLYESACDPNKLGNFTLESFSGMRGSPDHLNLVTLHSSKGLEFDVVIIMSMDQGRIPSWSASSPEAKNETRRLFYVGLTRARHEVHLVYSGWYANQYGRIFKNGPSEFLVELRESLSPNTTRPIKRVGV